MKQLYAGRIFRVRAGFLILWLWMGIHCEVSSQTLDPASLIVETKGDTGTHDPTIVREGNRFYRFSTGVGVSVSVSSDLHVWKSEGPALYFIPDWWSKDFSSATDLWAPEVVHRNGRWRMYYSISTFGKNVSAIGLASTPTLDPRKSDFGWIDEGPVVRSSVSDDFNAIDACVVQDAEGKDWLVYGSFWSGIKIRRLDSRTGKLPVGDDRVWSLASRDKAENAVEGAYVFRKGTYYYLFVSWGHCCRGLKSTYRIAMGRSKSVTGPYVDKDGRDLAQGGGSILLDGDKRDVGPGHCSLLRDGGKDYLVYHVYDARYGGLSKLRIEILIWDDGWPASPRQLLKTP